MIKEVTKVALPVDEVLRIQKRRIVPDSVKQIKGAKKEKEVEKLKRISIEEDMAEPAYIKTVRGLGYVME